MANPASTSISSIISEHRPSLEPYEDLYKKLHANPELSFLEEETAATIASHLTSLRDTHSLSASDFPIHTSIGGHGLTATLHNGSGPTILLRADIDALPVEEATGLPYASKKHMKDPSGDLHPVMHACGHDMHISSLLAATQLLLSARETWSGTLIFLFQPAEEKGAGAQAMVDDGLYTRDLIPIPDIVLGAHVMFGPSGTVGTRPGPLASSADSMKITLHGRGGHASQPHHTRDPILQAASTIIRLQGLVSRETNPADHAVVTVASMHAGGAENVIPAKAELKINMRAMSQPVRDRLLTGIRRVVDAEAVASDAPKAPQYETISAYPLTLNDVEATAKLSETMGQHFGDAFDGDCATLGGSEDFSILATAVGRPYVYWMYGGTDPKVFEDEKGQVPINHSPLFAPVIQPTLRFAVDGYAVAALTWLMKS